MELRAVRVERNGAFDAECRRLYRSSFPRIERIGYGNLLSLNEKGGGDLWAVLDGGRFAGMAFMVSGDPPCLLYFAVDPELRGRGCGSGSLDLIRSMYGRFFLFAEDPQDEDGGGIRRRRLSFYARNGLSDIGLCRRLEIPYRVIAHGSISLEEVDRACSGKEGIYLVGDANIDEGRARRTGLAFCRAPCRSTSLSSALCPRRIAAHLSRTSW